MSGRVRVRLNDRVRVRGRVRLRVRVRVRVGSTPSRRWVRDRDGVEDSVRVRVGVLGLAARLLDRGVLAALLDCTAPG